LARNEEAEIGACLGSLSWCDELFVVDSNSTDSTAERAKEAGAQVVAQKFLGFGEQRNFALDLPNMKSEWVLFLDADERATSDFAKTVRSAVEGAGGAVGFYCCSKTMLYGRWLKRSDGFPKWQLRLVRRGRARFVNYGHGQKESSIQGAIEYLREPYLHFAFSKGWTQWWDRHNRYALQEAHERLGQSVEWKSIFSPHASLRNKALKPLLNRIPGWPFFRFAIPYFLKGGFLEGEAGMDYCANIAFYEYLIGLKMREIQREKKSSCE